MDLALGMQVIQAMQEFAKRDGNMRFRKWPRLELIGRGEWMHA